MEHGSGKFHVEGMESVVATVSGYHGAERFNLIKLISQSGASYIGNMNQSMTHLVCWEFEGRKYDLAKKLNKLKKNKILIVNHCWVEECIKEGRRVPEEPYTFKSGKEMGPLRLEILMCINHPKAQSKALKKDKEPVIDVDLEDTDNAAWTDSILFDEQGQNSHRSHRPIRKAVKKTSTNASPSRNKNCIETLSGPSTMKLKQASNSSYSRRLEKRTSTSPEPWRKSRRLVKKQTTMEDWLLNVNFEEDCEEIKVLPESTSNDVPFGRSDVERHQSTSNRSASDIRCAQDNNNNNAPNEVENKDMNDENQKSHVHDPSSHLPSSEELSTAAYEDSIDIGPGNRPQSSSEVSCVICWTDFSSTRGLLPCGHRFCFSCIQSWADQMVSRGKDSTCPLCKAVFDWITKVDDAVPSDQKIYSQSIPHDSSNLNLYFLPDGANFPPSNASQPVCHICSSIEPEDLLVSCHSCDNRRVHFYCLDPPLFPWTCAHCMDLQTIYRQTRQFT